MHEKKRISLQLPFLGVAVGTSRNTQPTGKVLGRAKSVQKLKAIHTKKIDVGTIPMGCPQRGKRKIEGFLERLQRVANA